MALAPGEARKDLSADSIFRALRCRYGSLPDPRSGEVEIPLADALMSAFAMFSLKDPSLLAFDHRRRNPNDNFRTIYGINRVPSDSQMRAVLDPVDPADLRAPFREIFRRLQRGQVLKRFVYLDGHYLLSLDGTTYFSSSKIHCSSCLEKHHRNGSVTYSHQLLGATLVHPDLKEVIPLAPEPIIQQDGQAKNDCERNATRRWLKRFRQEHPHLPVIVVEDALSANAPQRRSRIPSSLKVSYGRIITWAAASLRFRASIWRFCSALRTFNRGGWGATCFFRRGGSLFILGPVRSRRSRPVCCNRLAKLLRGTGLRAASSSRRISRSTSAALHFNSSRPARLPPTFKANAPCPNKSWHASSETSASRTTMGTVRLTSRTSFTTRLYVLKKHSVYQP